VLFSAMFLFNSRDGASSAFTDQGLAELCRLHTSITTDTTVSGLYQGYEDFCTRTTSDGGTNPATLASLRWSSSTDLSLMTLTR
jgi:hypothetical protein